jgi:hypothetical protein
MARKPTTTGNRLSPTERDASEWCRTRGLWLFIEGSGKDRLWTVFRTSDGKEIGTYQPASGEHQRHNRDADTEANEWTAALTWILTGRYS